MRNLRLINRATLPGNEFLPLTATCWDVENDAAICAFGPSKDEASITLKKWRRNLNGEHELTTITSWDAPCPLPDLSHDKILSLHYFPESSTICLVLAGGDVIVVREIQEEGYDRIEIVGTIDEGILAAEWSYDEEQLCIVTRADTVLFMSRTFDSTANYNFDAKDLEASKHVSVGWGKAETQFKGRGARALKDPTLPDKVESGLSTEDNGEASISWRGDGQFVAISSRQKSDRRVIRVFNRDCELDGVSEPVDYMTHALSWRPSGNLIASIKSQAGKAEVIFFERNGLRHGQFDLRLSKEDLESWATTISLSWNSDSSILAVSFSDRVQLWTMGNYHYYLKQEVSLSNSPVTKINAANITWHPESPHSLLESTSGECLRLDYASEIFCSEPGSTPDSGSVAVVDGTSLLLTPLRYANVPPPMSLQTISCSRNIIHAHSLTLDGKEYWGCLTEEEITIFSWNPKLHPDESPARMSSIPISALNLSPGAAVRQVTLLSPIMFLVVSSWSEYNLIHVVRLTDFGHEIVATHKSSPLFGAVPILNLPGISTIVENSGVNRFEASATSAEPVSEISTYGGSSSLLHPDPKAVKCIRLVDSDITLTFSMLADGRLFQEKTLLARGCTSFVLTPLHLIFTTSQHMLKFVHLGSGVLEVPGDKPEEDERCRSIERGAKLVTAIPASSAVILQMPRGNLETIYPRAMVLASIRRDLDARQYKKALLTCRAQRVDMNILCDYRREEFANNVGPFIEQVQRVDLIDLFLSQLRDEDVTKTIYRDTTIGISTDQAVNLPLDSSGKVNDLCDAFISELRSRTATNLQNLITAHVCKIPPDLDSGLLEVASLRKKDIEHGEKAIEHICFLADPYRLYDSAMGLYDLELAVLIAQQVQMDPKEYLPFLQRLQDMPELDRKFSINNHLKRFTKALENLHAKRVFEPYQEYTIKHSLYAEALHLSRYEKEDLRRIMISQAESFESRSQWQAAGLAFEYLEMFEKASHCYRQGNLWEPALSCAALVPIPEAALQSLALDLIGNLIELKQFNAVGTIYLEYLFDETAAIKWFCKGYNFQHAIRLAARHTRRDLLANVVDAGLIESMGVITELLAECKSQLNAQVPRIEELRVKKFEQPAAFYGAEAEGRMDIPDDISIAQTNASTMGGTLFTRYTNRSGTVGTNATRRTHKNKKREERKRAQGKKGSVYEEEYLVNSVIRLIERVNATNEDIVQLVNGLLRRGMRERAKAVEDAMASLITLCNESVQKLFPPSKSAKPEATDENAEDMYQATGGDGVLQDSMLELAALKQPPIVKDFKKMSIF